MIQAMIYSVLFSTSGVVASGSGETARDHLFNFLTSQNKGSDRYAQWAAIASPKKSPLKRFFSRDDAEDYLTRKKLRDSSSDSGDKTQYSSSEARWNLYGRLGKLRSRAADSTETTTSSEEVDFAVPESKGKQDSDVKERFVKRYDESEASIESLYKEYADVLQQENPELRPEKLGILRNKATGIVKTDKTLQKRVFFSPRHREILDSVCSDYADHISYLPVAEMFRITGRRFLRNGLDPIGINRFTREYKEILKNQNCLTHPRKENESQLFTTSIQEGDKLTEQVFSPAGGAALS